MRSADAIPIAVSLLGTPYRAGGASPATGFDCSGFVMFVYASIGKSVPHYTVDIWNAFPRVPLHQLAPGDLILTDGLGHVGIYMGNGATASTSTSPQTGDVVKISSLAGRTGDIQGAVRPSPRASPMLALCARPASSRAVLCVDPNREGWTCRRRW